MGHFLEKDGTRPRDGHGSGGVLPNFFLFAKGLFMVVSKLWFEFSGGTKFSCPLFTSILPQFYLCFTSLFLLYLFLTPPQPAISNHGFETTVYKPLGLLVFSLPT